MALSHVYRHLLLFQYDADCSVDDAVSNRYLHQSQLPKATGATVDQSGEQRITKNRGNNLLAASHSSHALNFHAKSAEAALGLKLCQSHTSSVYHIRMPTVQCMQRQGRLRFRLFDPRKVQTLTNRHETSTD